MRSIIDAHSAVNAADAGGVRDEPSGRGSADRGRVGRRRPARGRRGSAARCRHPLGQRGTRWPGVARTVLREQVKELLIGRIIRGELGPGRAARRDPHRAGARHEPGAGARGAARPRAAAARRGRAVPQRARAALQPAGRARHLRRASGARRPRRRAAPAASSRATSAQLERELEEMRAAARSGDRARLIRHDLEFHRQILDVGGKPGADAVLGHARGRGDAHADDLPADDRPVAVAESHVGDRRGACARGGPPPPGARRAGTSSSTRSSHAATGRIAEPPSRRARRPSVPTGRARIAPRMYAGALSALFLAALSLRPQIVGAGPLIPSIQRDLHTTPRHRRPARDDPGALHGPVRAARGLPRSAGRHARSDDVRARH